VSHAGQRSERGGGRIRVAVADEDEVFRRRLTTLLADEEDIEVVGEVGDGMAAIGLAAATVPDVIVMDVWLPKRSGFDMWVAMEELAPNAGVILLTVGDEEADVHEAVKDGVSGCLLDYASIDEVAQAVRMAAERWSITPPMATRLLEELRRLSRDDRQQVATLQLTNRELEVLRLTAEGLTSREIAKQLYVSENTAGNHARNILQKRYWHIRRLP
jgi:two-component system NarL family response regulator